MSVYNHLDEQISYPFFRSRTTAASAVEELLHEIQEYLPYADEENALWYSHLYLHNFVRSVSTISLETQASMIVFPDIYSKLYK